MILSTKASLGGPYERTERGTEANDRWIGRIWEGGEQSDATTLRTCFTMT